jgi:parallel beta-helix repeat protein
LLLLALAAVAAIGGGVALIGDGTPEPEAREEALTPPAGHAATRCDAVLEEGGDVAAFVAGLRGGETGCLRGGTHVSDGVAAITAPDVVLTSYPEESATLVGRLWVKQGAQGSVVEDLTLAGANPDGKPSPTVNADDAILRGNDISNDHTAICVSINGYSDRPPVRGVAIEDNVIHDCGLLPATNHQHGIYVSNARNTVVKSNLIYGNADRGVQLYPDADDSVVTGNIIDGNGQGVIFGGGPSTSSDGNLVADNVITDSNIRWNIQSHWQGPVGSGNVARGNCVWIASSEYTGSPPDSGIEPAMDGARAFDNVVGDPGYDTAAGDFRIADDSPCASAGPAAG